MRTKRTTKLTPRQIAEYKEWLADLAEEAAQPGGNMDGCDPEVWTLFNPNGKTGFQIWSAFTEEELFAPVLKTMDRPGHTPQFNQIYCVYRKYLTKRYGSMQAITFRARALYKRKKYAQLYPPDWPERVSAAPLLAYCQEHGTDISEAHRAAIEVICTEAVRNRKPIDPAEVPPDTRGLLNALAGNWRRGYALMGIPLVSKGQMRNVQRSIDRANTETEKE